MVVAIDGKACRPNSSAIQLWTEGRDRDLRVLHVQRESQRAGDESAAPTQKEPGSAAEGGPTGQELNGAAAAPVSAEPATAPDRSLLEFKLQLKRAYLVVTASYALIAANRCTPAALYQPTHSRRPTGHALTSHQAGLESRPPPQLFRSSRSSHARHACTCRWAAGGDAGCVRGSFHWE